MESRTSPGKKGSVLPISEYLTGRFSAFPGLVSRPVGRGERTLFPLVWVNAFHQIKSLLWEERISLRPLLRSFCPGYPALPCRTATSLAASDFVNSFCNVWTALTFPRWLAR